MIKASQMVKYSMVCGHKHFRHSYRCYNTLITQVLVSYFTLIKLVRFFGFDMNNWESCARKIGSLITSVIFKFQSSKYRLFMRNRQYFMEVCSFKLELQTTRFPSLTCSELVFVYLFHSNYFNNNKSLSQRVL